MTRIEIRGENRQIQSIFTERRVDAVSPLSTSGARYQTREQVVAGVKCGPRV